MLILTENHRFWELLKSQMRTKTAPKIGKCRQSASMLCSGARLFCDPATDWWLPEAPQALVFLVFIPFGSLRVPFCMFFSLHLCNVFLSAIRRYHQEALCTISCNICCHIYQGGHDCFNHAFSKLAGNRFFVFWKIMVWRTLLFYTCNSYVIFDPCYLVYNFNILFDLGWVYMWLYYFFINYTLGL